MFEGILMIVIGAIAAASLVTKTVANSKELLEKIVPYQGYLGVIAFVWGIWGLIGCILGLSWIGTWPIWWITTLVIALSETVLGFMLGFGLISKYVLSKNDEAMKKGEEIRAKLAGYQVTIGLIGMGVGVWAILYKLILVSIIKM